MNALRLALLKAGHITQEKFDEEERRCRFPKAPREDRPDAKPKFETGFTEMFAFATGMAMAIDRLAGDDDRARGGERDKMLILSELHGQTDAVVAGYDYILSSHPIP